MTECVKHKFLHIPFGIQVFPGYFCMMIDEVLKGLEFYFTHPSDAIIYLKTKREQLVHIRQASDHLRDRNVKLKLNICDFLKTQIHYLGHILSQKRNSSHWKN